MRRMFKRKCKPAKLDTKQQQLRYATVAYMRAGGNRREAEWTLQSAMSEWELVDFYEK